MPKPSIWTVDVPSPPPAPARPQPMSPTARTTFEGFRTTERTVAMLTEARRLYGPGHPVIVQGGFNAGGVAASAGTHDRDALDFSIRWMSRANAHRWQDCVWQVGFAGWIRTRIAGLWETHFHAVPKGGDLSRGAANQVVNFRLGRNGLVGEASYSGIGNYANVTWESYLRHHP